MELLLVIGIIGLLAAISVPVVMQSLAKARNAAIKAEIDMLHMAIMNYKNEYGSFPPCFDSLSGDVNKHIQRLFPRASVSRLCANPSLVTPASSVVAWLTGFTNDPTDPLAVGNPALDRKKLFDFDQARQTEALGAAFPYGIGYFPSQKAGSPFIYVNSAAYGALNLTSGSVSHGWPAVNVTYTAGGNTYTINAGTYFPHKVPLTSAKTVPWSTQWNSGSAYFNPDTFQILSAGRDEEFGTDDDLSNFWKGTRQEYLDSLR